MFYDSHFVNQNAPREQANFLLDIIGIIFTFDNHNKFGIKSRLHIWRNQNRKPSVVSDRMRFYFYITRRKISQNEVLFIYLLKMFAKTV